MRYDLPILEGTLVRRYKRFLADVLIDGVPRTVLCPNTGSMSGLLDEGNPVRISGPHPNEKRKYAFTLEQIQVRRREGKKKLWVGVNTGLPNAIVEEAVHAGVIPGLEGYAEVRREVKLGERSRVDLFLSGHPEKPDCWLEVKNCTSVQKNIREKTSQNEGSTASFPDAVTTRGQKHVRELIERVHAGDRAVMLFTVQRSDATEFSPAWAFDPDYATLFYEAQQQGVEMLPMRVRITRNSVTLRNMVLPILDNKLQT